MTPLIYLVTLLRCIQIALSTYGATYYVSINGDDTNPGTKSEPFLTINRARDEIRSKGVANGGVLVYIRGGLYSNNNYSMYNEPVLNLNSANDSGEYGKPIVYSGYPGETVEIIGGYQVESSAFVPSTTYPDLLVADLSKLNSELWDNVEYGNLRSGGLAVCTNNRAELFVNGKRMVLARWPNIYTDSNYPKVDIFNFTQIVTVQNSNTSFTYEFSTERAIEWQKEVASANIRNSPWLHGYWSYDWADSYTQIQSIDTNIKTITTYANTPPVYGYKDKARYYGVNLISELDTKNEYYFDSVNKKVYINKQRQSTLSIDKYYISVNHYPVQVDIIGNEYKWGKRKDFWNNNEYTSRTATPPGKSGLKASFPIPLQYTNVSSSIEYLTIENITIAYGIQCGLYVPFCAHCNFNNIHILGIGEVGAVVHGYNNTISNIVIQYTGCTGMSVEGGDTNSLIRGNNMVMNSNISYMAEWKRTYMPGYAFGGVGNIWKHNYVGYGPHQGMFGECNDCLFESNTFDTLCYESSDSGAWYSGRSWVHRGSIISNNLFIKIRNIEKTVLGSTAVQAVYLDDQLSAHNITGNQFIDSYAGILLGGGRRVEINNNRFAGCNIGVEYDDRGLTWQQSFCKPNGTFNQELDAVHYKEAPWSTHYPYLPDIFNEQPCTPVFDHINHNQYCCGFIVNCKMVSDSSATCQGWNSTCDDNTQTNWSNEYC